MITFFTICRPFEGEFNDLQRMAIGSWREAAGGDAQILLMGDVVGIERAAHDLDASYLPDIPTNEHGTELVNAAFEMAERHGVYDLMCEISADITLGADFYFAMQNIREVECPFVIGQRWDIDPGAPAHTADLYPPNAIDYFVYRRGTLGEIPPFAVGRTAYDNWLVWAAVNRWGLQAIDATDAITAIHVRHGHPEYGSKEKMLQSDEKRENYRLGRETGCDRWYRVTDAPYVLTADGQIRERAHA